MSGVLVDSSVLLDVLGDDAEWADWSEATLEHWGATDTLYINPIVYAEVSVGFGRIEELEGAVQGCGLVMLEIPKEALFLAGKAFLEYRKRKGAARTPLPDFFIGAHAAVSELRLITRDPKRVSTYFPTATLIRPDGKP